MPVGKEKKKKEKREKKIGSIHKEWGPTPFCHDVIPSKSLVWSVGVPLEWTISRGSGLVRVVLFGVTRALHTIRAVTGVS